MSGLYLTAAPAGSYVDWNGINHGRRHKRGHDSGSTFTARPAGAQEVKGSGGVDTGRKARAVVLFDEGCRGFF